MYQTYSVRFDITLAGGVQIKHVLTATATSSVFAFESLEAVDLQPLFCKPSPSPDQG